MNLLLMLLYVLIGISIFSGVKMLRFLELRGYDKTPLYKANPTLFLVYAKITKNENGHIGIYFTLFCVSIFFAAFLMIFQAFIELVT